MIEASAPGKVVLSGEYAVLEGAPAVCMAVTCRAMVNVTTSPVEQHVVTAPGHIEERRRFCVRDGAFEWLDGGDGFELFEQVWLASGIDRSGGLELRLDTRAFLDTASGSKTGIGSSAALSVALAHALRGLGRGNRDPLDVAYRAHLAFQGGRGSGVDIATSAAGGIVEYRMAGRATAQLTLPEGLEYTLCWSGTPASTGRKLEQLDARAARPSRQALVEAAQSMAGAWASGAGRHVLAEYRRYIRALREFSDDHGLGIFAAGHAEVSAAADEAGLVYKPCGAGGGDIGILLADDRQRANEFVATSLPASFEVLDLYCDPQGVEATGTLH